MCFHPVTTPHMVCLLLSCLINTSLGIFQEAYTKSPPIPNLEYGYSGLHLGRGGKGVTPPWVLWTQREVWEQDWWWLPSLTVNFRHLLTIFLNEPLGTVSVPINKRQLWPHRVAIDPQRLRISNMLHVTVTYAILQADWGTQMNSDWQR